MDNSIHTHRFDQQSRQTQEQRRSALISAFALIAAALVTIAISAKDVLEPGIAWQYNVSYVTLFVFLFLAIYSTVLIWRGSLQSGVVLMLGGLLALLFVTNLLLSELGLLLAVLAAALVIAISLTTLSTRLTGRLAVIGLVTSILIALVDSFFPINRPPALEQVQTALPYLAGIIVFSYAVVLVLQQRRISLYLKFPLAILSATLLAIAALAIQSNRLLEQSLIEQENQTLLGIAHQAANSLDNFINSNLELLRTQAQLPDFPAYLTAITTGETDNPNDPVTEEEIYEILPSFSRRDPTFILSYALLDSKGNVILDTNSENTGRNESNFLHFSQPKEDGLPFVSDVLYDEDNAQVIYFSAPIRNEQREFVGVLRVKYSAAILQQIINQFNNVAGEHSTASLLDENLFFLADGADAALIGRTIESPTAELLTQLTEQKRLPPDADSLYINSLYMGAGDLRDGLRNFKTTNVFISETHLQETGEITSLDQIAVDKMASRPWFVAFSQTREVFLHPVAEQRRAIAATSIVIAIIAAAISITVTRWLTSPIERLSATADQISKGDLTARASIITEDEIGQLAETFNRMTEQLNQTLTGLEQRVADRTADLEMARQHTEKRARELQIIAEISSTITSEQKLDTLLPLVTRLVSESFDFYHVGIFMIDETRQFAALQAANSEGGKNMLLRGHKLGVGATGIVGYVAQHGEPRIALDVGTDAVFFNNPDLPNTRSEMALPLISRRQTIGVLDVQSNKPGAFTENDVKTLGILADQVATAIENARLFAQTQQALAESQALYSQYVRESWGGLSQVEATVGYYHTLTGGQKLASPVESPEIRQVMNRGSITVLHADGNIESPTIIVPVKLRGQVIGTLNIKAPTKDRQWSQDEINLAEAVSERLSLALENARLFEETTRRAERERLVSDITTKIRGTNDPQEMIRTAVQELQQALGVTRVEIVPQKLSPPPDR